MRDPITGRDISQECWNGKHQAPAVMPGTRGTCNGGGCRCLCHPRNRKASEPMYDGACTYCFGTGELPISSTSYIPCPKCKGTSKEVAQ